MQQHPARSCLALVGPGLEAVVRRERSQWVGSARRNLGPAAAHEAEDAVQDAVLAVWEAFSAGRPLPDAMAPWLAAVVRVQSCSHRRGVTLRGVRNGRVVSDPTFSPGDGRAPSPVCQAFQRALPGLLQHLSAAQQQALQYRVLEDLSWPDTAARMGCTVDAARHAVGTALTVLRARGAAEGLWTLKDCTGTREPVDSTDRCRIQPQVSSSQTRGL